MTDTTLRQLEFQASTDARTVQAPARGTGRFSRLTYGTGKSKVTNVMGASPSSMDWNGPDNNK